MKKPAMELILKKKILKENLKLLKFAISNKALLPILKCLRIQTVNNKVVIYTTDLDKIIKINIPATIINKGSAVFEFNKFNKIVNNATTDFIKIKAVEVTEVDNDKPVIIETAMEFKIRSYPEKDYPMLDYKKSNTLNISKLDLKTILSKIIYAISKDETRPVLTKTLIKVGNDFSELCCTDSYRIGLYKLVKIKDTNCAKITSKEYLIDGLFLNNIVKNIKKITNIQIFKTGFGAGLKFDNVEITDRTKDLNYPKTDYVTSDKKHKQFIEVNRKQLLTNAIQMSKFVDKWSNDFITFNMVNCDSLKIEYKDSLRSNPEIEINNELSIHSNIVDGLELRLNVKYVIDTLKAIEKDTVEILIKDNLSPVIIKDDNFKHIIMPIRIS